MNNEYSYDFLDAGAESDPASRGDLSAAATPERRILSAKELASALTAMAKAIVKSVGPQQDLYFVGIQTRGVPLAARLAEACGKIAGRSYPQGMLDINLYRDDLSEVDHHPVVKRTELPGPISGKGIILVDDVLFTGRTIRAALDALVDFGRPRFVQLAILIDRGFRELPIHADYIGKTVETHRAENVKVLLESIDGRDEVLVTH